MIELTDADRARIEHIIGDNRGHIGETLYAFLVVGVEYGIAAGLERAAKVCEDYAQTEGAKGEWLGGCISCAAAIRALLDKD